MSEEIRQISYDNLFPGTKFTINGSENIYILIGYTSNRNIVYFNDVNNNYVNNLIISDQNLINKIVFEQKSYLSEKIFK